MPEECLKISVERLLEQEVDEISRSGEETYIKPFTISEELSYFASKIDFHGTHEDILPDNDDGGETKKKKKKKMHQNGEEEEEKVKANGEENKNEVGRWQWESVHSKLRLAMSEVCVMLDVLQCLHRKKYLVLDPIQQNQEPNKQTVQMFGSRKCLAQAGATIAKGARALSTKKKNTLHNAVVEVEENEKDEYYMQLMHLRQYWRVKKTGVQITGDVTFRSVGSKFWHPGLIEVKAAHDVTDDDNQRKLVVNISPDLQQLSALTVEITDNSTRCPWVAKTDLIRWRESKTAFEWENNLQLAQTHLFNLEIFSLLCNEAFQGSYNNIEVLDGRICCRILDDVDICITHNVGEEGTEIKMEETPSLQPLNVSASDLTLLLSNLLLCLHEGNVVPPSLYPATSNYLQRPMNSSSVHNLLSKPSMVKHRNGLLHDFLKQAKHKVWVTRLINFLDNKSVNTKNSILQIHWNAIKHRLVSTCSLLIITRSYAVTTTICLLLSVEDEGFTVTFENAEKLKIPFDLKILEEVIDFELKNELIKMANMLCVQHGWNVVQSSSKYSLINKCQDGNMHNGSIFYSRKCRRFINMYVLNINHVEVEVSVSPAKECLLQLDDKFKWLNVMYAKLPWSNLPGRTFAEKIECLFLCV